MAQTVRGYFDNKVPVAPGEGRAPAPPKRTWQQAWNNASKQLFVVLPNQLDRARVHRNNFLRAVR